MKYKDAIEKLCEDIPFIYRNSISVETNLVLKETYISKKNIPSVNTLKFKPIGDGTIQVFSNSGDYKSFFRLSKKQVNQLKEWLNNFG